METQTYAAKPEQFIAMMNMHYRAADFFAKEMEKSKGAKRDKMRRGASAALDPLPSDFCKTLRGVGRRRGASAALELAEAARVNARALGAKV